jgi:hypothetical protein
MSARKAAVSRGMGQWPPRRMDIPANREDPACIGRCSCIAGVNKAGVVEPVVPRRMAVFAGFTSFQMDQGGSKIGID